MQGIFPGYYPFSETQFKQLWNEGNFYFDANILHDLYRSSQSTREDLIQQLELLNLKNKIFLPYQAAFEFSKNRVSEIEKQMNAYQTCIKNLDDTQEKLKNQINNAFSRHYTTNPKNLLEKMNESFSQLFSQLKDFIHSESKQHPNLLEDDTILEKINQLFDGKIVEQFSKEQLLRLKQEAELRFSDKIPPGYEDKSKPENKYGDVFIWFQIIEHTKKTKIPAIFITGDTKEDWFKDKKQPRPELINEFFNETGCLFYAYSLKDFLYFAKKYLHISFKEETIQEIKEIQEENEHIEQAQRTSQLLEECYGHNQIKSKNFFQMMDYLSGYKGLNEIGLFSKDELALRNSLSKNLGDLRNYESLAGISSSSVYKISDSIRALIGDTKRINFDFENSLTSNHKDLVDSFHKDLVDSLKESRKK